MNYQQTCNNFSFSCDFLKDDDYFLSNIDFDFDFSYDIFDTNEIQDSSQTQDESYQNMTNNENKLNQAIIGNEPKRKRRPKEHIILNEFSLRFYKNMCYTLKGNPDENIRKELVLKYHKIACQRNQCIRIVKRSEYRSINRYFNAFADQQYLILQAFQEMVSQGIINYEEDYRILISKKLL